MLDKKAKGGLTGRATKELDSRDSLLNAQSSYAEYFKYVHRDYGYILYRLFYGLVSIDFI